MVEHKISSLEKYLISYFVLRTIHYQQEKYMEWNITTSAMTVTDCNSIKSKYFRKKKKNYN